MSCCGRSYYLPIGLVACLLTILPSCSAPSAGSASGTPEAQDGNEESPSTSSVPGITPTDTGSEDAGSDTANETLPEESPTPPVMMPEEEDSVATVVLTIEVEGLGSVSLSPLGAMVDGGFEYSRSAVVTLNAIPADGWVFTGWLNENLPETPEVSVALENSLTVGVRFDPFIAGDVFSFLTPDETGLFLALTGAAQHEITVALVETQDAIDQDYASRGSIGSSQWCGDRCDALQIAVDLWRLSTWENLAIVLGDNYLFLTQQQIEEVNEWNLAKYPDAPEAELSGFTCNC